MRNLIIALAALCTLSPLMAQSPDAIRNRLALPTNSQVGSIEINKDSSAEQALTKINAHHSSQSVMGYRIGIFFDNGQDARSKATEARDEFSSHFRVPVYISYQSPYYKVSAGDCLTEEEAIMLFERIRPLFPNAYVMREKMQLSSFIIDESLPLPTEDIIIEQRDSVAEQVIL